MPSVVKTNQYFLNIFMELNMCASCTCVPFLLQLGFSRRNDYLPMNKKITENPFFLFNFLSNVIRRWFVAGE